MVAKENKKIKHSTSKKTTLKTTPIVAVVMGSKSDWDVMEKAVEIFESFGINHICKVVSAHRTPDLLYQFARDAKKMGIKVIIAGAGGAAHLPGMLAAITKLPVLGVPIPSKHLNGLDSLLSIVQMPKGIPVGTLAIGEAGAQNAAWLALQILAISDERINRVITSERQNIAQKIGNEKLPP